MGGSTPCRRDKCAHAHPASCTRTRARTRARAHARTHSHTHETRARAPATAERQIDGEEIKVQQPRQNRKKKVKGRIYQKLKKGQIEEGEVGDGVEDMAEDKVSARR